MAEKLLDLLQRTVPHHQVRNEVGSSDDVSLIISFYKGGNFRTVKSVLSAVSNLDIEKAETSSSAPWTILALVSVSQPSGFLMTLGCG
ncbi:MAG: hypothetical protein QNJ97_03300 [Myxococcota bacterium]|nr:hypothetical protein [Myxococcota bacterium]